MTHEEKRSWIMLIVSVIAYTVYVILILGRLGDRVGQSFVVIGAVAAMLMAMAEWDRFWIANVIYLCFALSAVLGNVTKVIVYRRSFPQW